MDPTYPLFPIFAFLGFVLSIIPLPWHLQAWNSGTCAFMLWTAVTCLVEFINAIVWKGNVNNVAPVWCDISTQILLGSNIGIPASILCISRRLYKITSIQAVSTTRKDKRNDILIDLGIAVGVPVIVLVLHTIVHPHRFDIFEDIGCYPVTYSTLPAYFLYYPWPIVLASISFIYSSLTLRSFFVRRAQFSSLMSSSASINMNRYVRLMLLCVCDMSLTVPLAIYVLYISTHGIPLAPWISWAETHYNWTRVDVVPSLLWRSSKESEICVELTRWLAVFCAFTFFALFGFATEAKKNYKKVFWAIASRCGLKRSTTPKPGLPSWHPKPLKLDSQATLPVYTVSHPPPKRKTSSFCCGEEMELGLYSPNADKCISPTTPSTPAPTYASSVGSMSHVACGDMSIYDSGLDVDVDIDISEAHPASPPPRFEDNFKPLPPLPSTNSSPSSPTRSPFTYSPYGPLRHAASMPLQRSYEYEISVPTTRGREGSITVLVEQTSKVDS